MDLVHIDSDTVYRERIDLLLKHADFNAFSIFNHSASTIEEVISDENLEPSEVQLAILEINDELGDALSKFRHVTELFSNASVIILTNIDNVATATYCLKHGAADYILKSNTRDDELIRGIVSALKGRELTKQSMTHSYYLREVIEKMGVGIWDWNLKNGQCFVNAEWAKISGYSVDELYPFDIESLLKMMPHAEDVERTRQVLDDFWQGKTSIYRSEYRIRHKDGHTIWVEDIGCVVEWKNNSEPYRMVGTHQDITERKRDEEELKKLSLIASESINGVVMTDANGITEWVNDGFIRLSGYTLDEVKGKKPGAILQGEKTSQATVQQIREALEKNEGFNVEIINYHKNGEAYWVHIQCNPIYDQQGVVKAFMAIETDISERVRSAKKLKRQQDMLEQMSQIGKIGAWEVDLVRGEIYWSEMTKQIHEVPSEYSPNLETAINFYKPGYSRRTIQNLVNKCIETGEPYATELQLVTYKNREIWVSARGRAEIQNGAVTRMFGTFQDITKKKQVEAELIESKNRAEVGAKVKSEFLASMSHEIRTPINGVIGMLHLLERSDLNDDQSRKVSLAKSSADSLLTLINDILDFSKLEENKVELEEIKFDATQLVAESVQAIAIKAQEKNLDLILDATEIRQRSVLGDPFRIRQVINNLISNAIKFTEDGQVSVRCKTELEDSVVLLTIEVEDSGIGIPDDKVKNLFQSFSQVDSSTTRKYGGTGLGLVISKKLCNLMGGDLFVDSKLGVGSCFSFTVNVRQAKGQAPKKPITAKRDVFLLMKNKSHCKVISKQLNDWGMRVTESTNANDMLEQINSRHIEKSNSPVLCVDTRVVDHSLDEITQRIRNKYGIEELVLVGLVPISNFDNMSLNQESKHFVRWLNLPVSPDELALALNINQDTNYLEQRKERDSDITSNSLQPKLEQKTDVHWPQGTRILLVEDNIINIEVAVGILGQFGLTVETATNGREAIDIIEQSHNTYPYNLVLMDCLMPEMDGYKATACIRQGHAGENMKELPIIAMTANAMKGDREKCLAAGMNDYIAKPIEPDILFAKLKKYLLREGHEEQQGKFNKEVDDSEKNSQAILVWDKSAALRRLGGRQDKLIMLLTMFVKTMPEKIEELAKKIEHQQYDEAFLITHTIKGMVSSLGFSELNTFLVQLESSIKSDEKSVIESTFNQIPAAFSRAEAISLDEINQSEQAAAHIDK